MRLRFVVVLAAAIPAALHAQQKQRFASLEDALRAGPILAGRQGPASLNWIDGGRRFSYIDRDGRTGQSVLRGYDPATQKDTLLFAADGLTFPGTQERFAYQSFQWAPDSKHLVFQSHFKPIYRRSGTSDYYLYSLGDRTLKLAASGAGTAQLSPDGAMMGYERAGDMYVADVAGGGERRLTTGATEHVYNGKFDWVYEEEFGLAQAWNWSPDNRYIAYWQTDDGAEPVTQLSDLSGAHPTFDQLRVPQVGDSNPRVRIGVVDVKGGKTVWLDVGETAEHYIPRVYWTSRADTAAVIVLNRRHDELKLYFFDVRTGGRRLVMTETSKTWIDVFDFYAGIQDMMTFPAGSHEFLWISDRDGWQHVYRYDYSGKLVKQVTTGPWSVTRIEGTDPAKQLVYYSSTQASPLQRQLYAVKYDGTGVRRITTERGTHAINMSPNAAFFIDRWSNTEQPTKVSLRAANGAELKRLEDNAATSTWLTTHAYAPTETFTFRTSDSVNVDASVIRPIPFDSTKKYPVVFAVYGGPGSQAVYDRFGASAWTQWLAQQGYVVVDVNNRASNNYGRDFMKVVYKHLGEYEAKDFAEAARFMATKPWVDPKHVAIMGTSYGGYSTLEAMERYPDVFPVGIANSAVTDWRYYDSIYTERYMGLLGDNLAGYEASSPLVNAKQLSGHLLLIHSLLDDNVHPQHTMQLLTALTNAGKDVDFRLYPQGRHGAVYSVQSQLLIMRTESAFLARWLKFDGGASVVPIQ